MFLAIDALATITGGTHASIRELVQAQKAHVASDANPA